MNKTTIISIAIFFVTGFVMGAMLRGCAGSGPHRAELAVVHSDTITRYIPRTDTLWRELHVLRNIPYKVYGRDTFFITKTERISACDTQWIPQYVHRGDTAIYSDTLRLSGRWKAAITDTLTANRIIGRGVSWADLSPIEQRSITNTIVKKTPLLKVYLGVDAFGGMSGARYDLDIAPAGSFVFADRYMFDLGYFVLNRQLTAGLKVKLSFRK